MTNVQFRALALRLEPARLISEVRLSPHRANVRTSSNYAEPTVSRWLLNGWNTEFLLHANAKQFQGEALRHSLHWAFPQAYYAVFAVALGFFKTVGWTEESHAGVIRKIGSEMLAGRYPDSVGFLLIGGKKRALHRLMPGKLSSSVHFDSTLECVDAHIAQFLGSTRSIDLRAKRADVSIKNWRGAKKKKLSDSDWEKVSSALGPTSIMSLLYRKRIKANYRDIDTFLHPELNAGQLYDDLGRCVGAINYVHESFIAKALGTKKYRKIVNALAAPVGEFISRRVDSILSLDA